MMFLLSLDINECQRRVDSCEDVCYNTMGSYICDCTKEGFKLSYDMHSCEGKQLKFNIHLVEYFVMSGLVVNYPMHVLISPRVLNLKLLFILL